MTEKLISSNHKKPNLRHFYAYEKDGVFQSGLKVDYVRLTNTVMAPREEAELEEDVQLIRTGMAKCKELFYLDTRSLTSLTLRITLSLSFILSTFTSMGAILPGGILGETGDNNIFLSFIAFYILCFLQSLISCGILIFILTWLIKRVYLSVGITRFRVLTTVFNINFLLMSSLSIFLLFVYLYHPPLKINILVQALAILFYLTVLPSLTTLLSSINIRHHHRIRIEIEWQVNGRIYGEHLNQDDVPVLYPKRAHDFYSLNPIEYRTLVAYQKARGDHKQVKQLLKVWRTKPLVVEEDKRLFAIQNSNLLRRIGVCGFRVTTSLLAILLELLSNFTSSRTLKTLSRSLKIRGIDRVFWIYQECETALKQLAYR